MIPRDTLSQIESYAKHRCPPGGFLWAVLSNDLMLACKKADDANRAAFFEIVEYVDFQLPVICRGSMGAVESWLSGHDMTLGEWGGGS